MMIDLWDDAAGISYPATAPDCMPVNTIHALEELQTKLSHAIESTVGIHAGLRRVEPHTIERGVGKAKRVIDKGEA